MDETLSSKQHDPGVVVEGAEMNETRKSEKRLYKRLIYGAVGPCVVAPEDMADVIEMDGEQPDRIEDVWLTDAEFEALPDFES
jgi:hypothetical protein